MSETIFEQPRPIVFEASPTESTPSPKESLHFSHLCETCGQTINLITSRVGTGLCSCGHTILTYDDEDGLTIIHSETPPRRIFRLKG